MEIEYREVMFCNYCSKCKYANASDVEEPCNECLDNPVNIYTERPVKFVEDE